MSEQDYPYCVGTGACYPCSPPHYNKTFCGKTILFSFIYYNQDLVQLIVMQLNGLVKPIPSQILLPKLVAGSNSLIQ